MFHRVSHYRCRRQASLTFPFSSTITTLFRLPLRVLLSICLLVRGSPDYQQPVKEVIAHLAGSGKGGGKGKKK